MDEKLPVKFWKSCGPGLTKGVWRSAPSECSCEIAAVVSLLPVVTWLVLVYTADDRGAGTDANVQMVIYGKNEKGESIKSDEIPLDNNGDNFESGQEDQFKIETIDVGKPYKIRVWHDNSGSFAAWKLDRVSI